MGMFDDITYEAPCPICGAPLTGWQSKSGDCALQQLTPSELWLQRHDRLQGIVPDTIDFYADCDKCGTWVEVHLSGGHVAHSKEHRDRVMDEIEAEGLGLREYYKRLGPQARGPIIRQQEE